MVVRMALALSLLVSLAMQPATTAASASAGALAAQQSAMIGQNQASSERAIRRDVPLTNAIVRAMEAGTRDFTGRPGPNYWQLQTDYTINVSLDPATATLSGEESIVLHNNSPSELDRIVLRLDHNIFRPRVPRGSSVPAETTEGMVVTRIRVDGQEVSLNAPARGGRRGRGNAPRRLGASGLDQTVAMISLATPIAANSVAILEIEWHTKLPGGPDGRGHRMTQRWDDTLFQPTQWFPRIAKYDDLRGWDTSVYLGPAEFFNNFGTFDVRIDVPAGWIVSGTGVLQNPEEVLTATAQQRLGQVLGTDEITTIVDVDEVGPGQATASGDRLVWHFVADMVNDFAWATAEKFIWQATRADIPGKRRPGLALALEDELHEGRPGSVRAAVIEIGRPQLRTVHGLRDDIAVALLSLDAAAWIDRAARATSHGRQHD